jgi:hypothetical protein
MDREIVDGRRLVVRKTKKNSFIFIKFNYLIKVNFAKPKQKTPISSNSSSDRSQRVTNNHYQSLGFSTPPTARRQHLSGFSSLSSTPTRPTTTNNYHRYYL